MKKVKQLPGQISLEEAVPVKICGYAQNVYRRDYAGIVHTTSNPNKKQEFYTSLEKKTLPNGYIEGIVKKEYPINSESVSSLAEGADYRNDPAQAVSAAPKRVNLGDVTEAQAFLDNPQYAASLFNDIKAKLAAYYSSVTKTEKEQESTEKGVENNG